MIQKPLKINLKWFLFLDLDLSDYIEVLEEELPLKLLRATRIAESPTST